MARIANDNDTLETTGGDDMSYDMMLPFQLQESGLRGRFVRIGAVLDDILGRHNYPAPVAHMVADIITLALALSSMLKYEGVFTLQTSSKGAVKTLVADVQNNGDVRGCATFDEDMLANIKPSSDNGTYGGYSLRDLTGEEGGYIAFTVDQGSHAERYQGIVSLEGENLQESISHYFEQSEQLRTSIFISSECHDDGAWRSGALMLQYLPDDHADNDDIVAFNEKSESDRKEDWLRSKTLLQTCTSEEVLNSDLHPHDLLTRLFHEEGVIVYDAKSIQRGCRCSQERVESVIASMSDDDKAHAANEKGVIEMTCEFCSKTYTIKV